MPDPQTMAIIIEEIDCQRPTCKHRVVDHEYWPHPFRGCFELYQCSMCSCDGSELTEDENDGQGVLLKDYMRARGL